MTTGPAISAQAREFARTLHFARVAAAVSRRADRHMPGNPFPPDSPWGRELDRMHRQDRAAERFDREVPRPRSGRAGR